MTPPAPPVRSAGCCVIARGRHRHLANVLDGLARQRQAPDEVVVVSMGDPDVIDLARRHRAVTATAECTVASGEPMPLARARNLGASLLDVDLLVFLDVDCIPDAALVADYRRQAWRGLLMGGIRYLPPGVPDGRGRPTDAKLRAAGRRHRARPVPRQAVPTDRYELFWSLNFAVRREVWGEIGGFDERYQGYGGEDTDLAYTARRAGLPAWFVAGAEAYHQHHESQTPPVQHLHDIVANAFTFRTKWGTWPMIGWLEAFAELGLITMRDDEIVITADASERGAQV